MLKPLSLAVLICALPTTAIAQVQSQTCLTRAEAEGLMTYSLPSIVRAMSGKCAAALPATAPLIQAGNVTAARYQPDADTAFPTAKLAFDKLAGTKMSEIIGDAGTQKLIGHTISTGVASKIQAKDCGTIDRILDILQPLPAKNMAMLFTAILELGANEKEAKESPLHICQAPVATTSLGSK